MQRKLGEVLDGKISTEETQGAGTKKPGRKSSRSV
jgi:hypothetical protein